MTKKNILYNKNNILYDKELYVPYMSKQSKTPI